MFRIWSASASVGIRGRADAGAADAEDSDQYAQMLTIEKINVPEDWKSVLKGLEPDDLLMAIHPNQEYGDFFAIGCAYKKAGGSFAFFWKWCKDWKGRPRVLRQWRGWNKCEKTYGYPFLKRVALHSSTGDECSAHLNEAFGFDPQCRTTHFNSTYLHAHVKRAESS